MSKILSIIVPAYNEEKTIAVLLQKVVDVSLIGGMQKEIIVVNDGSRDRTAEIDVWDDIHNVLRYSYKRFLFSFVPLVWFYIAANQNVKWLFDKAEEFMFGKKS
ncbi:MAG: glycosyltransferase [Tannerella sp.]|nr:glycosyltransferase [Tannerella sp.]